MVNRSLAAALAIGGMIVSATAFAADLQPVSARLVKLDSVSALTYYTVEKDGFRVVTTLQPSDAAENAADATPVRFVVTLAPGQKTVVSVPRAAGTGAVEVEIARVGDTIRVSEPTVQTAAR
jgi:hypothetical protein